MSTSIELSKKDLQSIRGALRVAFIRSEFRRSYLDSKTFEEFRLRKDGSRFKKATKYVFCENCYGKFMVKDVNVDHKVPIGQFFTFKHTAGFIERLWCSFDNLQILCKSCHDSKTSYERSLIKGYNKL